MSEATMTSKGQLTVPAEIRQALGLAPGTRIRFTPLPDGTIVMRAKSRSLLDLEGAFPSAHPAPLPVEDMRIGED